LVGSAGIEQVLSRRNTQGKTLDEVLDDIGYKGDYERGLEDVEYFVELHIEQVPVLYGERIPIGVVENITGVTWIKATIIGEGNHAGTTPMNMRRDALLAASEVISFVNKRASDMSQRSGASTVATVGKLNVFPNGTNVIPGMVEMSIDIRDVVQGNMEELKDAIIKALRELERKYGVGVDIQIPIAHVPASLSSEVVRITETSAQQLGIKTKRMNSGAAHDAQNLSQKVKTGMIFVPSVHGVSHSPMEWTDWEDVEIGLRVLTQTLKNLSRIAKDR
jgi:N-carbamoyl-L-amino-acid hydrolase